MCRLKSGIILKDQVFIPDYDSHTDMLKELGIEDNEINAKILFIRAELLPTNNDIFSNISTWKFKVDQDIRPNWFIYNYDKQRMIEAVKEWGKNHIFENVDELLELKGNDKYYLKNCKNVEAYDNCKIIARGNCTINAYNSCKIYAYDDCIVKAYDNCTVNAVNNCTVYAQNESTINVFNNCIVKAQNKCVVTAHGNCKVRAYDNCIITAQDKCTTYAFNNCTVKVYGNCKAYVYDKCIVNTHDKCKIYYK